MGTPMTELKCARIKAGLKQDEVAERFKVARATVSNHESGKTMVTFAQLKAYAKLYGVEDYRELCPDPKSVRGVF